MNESNKSVSEGNAGDGLMVDFANKKEVVVADGPSNPVLALTAVGVESCKGRDIKQPR